MPVEPKINAKNPFSEKISKLTSHVDKADGDFFESLMVLSETYTTNCIRSRRNLRSAIEKQRLEAAEGFLREIEGFNDDLGTLSVELDSMSSSCSMIKRRLQLSKFRMEQLVSQTSSNQDLKNAVALTSTAANAILKLFSLDQSDGKILEGPVRFSNAENVLKTLDRVQSIHQLFCSTLGLPATQLLKDVLAALTAYIDKAYDCLYQWVKKEVNSQHFEAVEISVTFKRALQELQKRPILFKYLLDEYANARRQIVAQAFVNALTLGWNTGGSHKPIDLQSHDPVRYTGDMVAWLHQSSASEREYLRSLISDNADAELIQDCLNNVTGGLAYPLQLHLEQLLICEQNAFILYKVNNLLQFYSSVIKNLLGANCTLYMTLSELQSLSWNLFVGALQRQISDLLVGSGFPHHDLLPSSSAMEAVRLLEAILTTQDMSCALPDVRQSKCEEIVSVGVTPLLQHFESVARYLIVGSLVGAQHSPPPTTKQLPPESLVFLINSLHALYNVMSRLEFTGTQIAVLTKRLEQVMSHLTQLQATHVFVRAGLQGLREAIDTTDPAVMPLLQRGPSCSQTELQLALHEFNSVYLASPDSWELPESAQIAYPRPRNELRRRTADLVNSIYAKLYAAISDPRSGYPVTSPTWNEDLRTPEQVATLLLSLPHS